MSKDMMSSEEWGKVWSSRRRGQIIKERVKNRALHGLTMLIKSWADLCEPEPSIVELGCAPGEMLRRIKSAVPEAKLKGIDYSENGLEQTKKSLQEYGINADLILGDIFSFTPSSLSDLVVSFGLIEHFTDPAEVIRMHRKFAKPGGLIAVTVPNFAHPVVVKALRRYRPHDLETHRLEIMSEKALHKSFESAGCIKIITGHAVGPLLPAPESVRINTLPYGLFSMFWNSISFLIPSSLCWPGLYWSCGRVPE
jgi:2-polyprenyl-3-methyl-5-hydroxy-6-metoxy-1,4-benzoquinol methylase